MEALETQVAELTNLLDQARTRTDIAAVRDMLDRAGMHYCEKSGTESAILTNASEPGQWIKFEFDMKSGRLLKLGH